MRARCSKCHSDEGSKLYLDTDGDYTALTAALPNSTTPLSTASDINCRTCHKPHEENELLEAASAGRSSEFNTCTNCHQLLDSSGNQIVAYHDPTANPYGDLVEIITDTHFATPGDFPGGANVNDITGYAMDFGTARVCLDCHNPHNADTTINKQWAESKHADNTAAGAWAHYNWTEATGGVRNDGSAASNRTACQRCHTTTGVIAYLAANADADDSDYTAPLAYNPNFKPEMLRCNGCHTNNVGGLRATGRITADYTDAPFQYPNVGASNLCMACHTGRESGESIQNSVADFSDKGFVNSHYLTAGGTVFTATGYEFTGQDYSNPSPYAHDQIGMGTDTRLTDWEAENGADGPCIGCHLSSPESHTYLPVEHDANGEITEVTATVCINCHDGVDQSVRTPEILEEQKTGIEAALEALSEFLSAKGYDFTTSYPYFSNRDWTAAGDATGKNDMGAAFNYNLLVHDPGAFAHNRFYAKRLIFDAIDWLDNTTMDGTIDLTDYPEAATYLDSDRTSDAEVLRP